MVNTANENGNSFSIFGYDIPVDLINKTGGGPNTFKYISDDHIRMIRKYAGLEPSWNVLELGCGIGRDAMPLADILNSSSKYYGFDIIKPSIEWCQNNITPRHHNFLFFHQNIKEPWFNPGGTLEMDECTLPVEDASIDLVILQSVFTHLSQKSIIHYLKEFRRVLRSGGKIYASFFILDETIRSKLTDASYLQFRYILDDGSYCQDLEHPTIAYGYSESIIDQMATIAGLEIVAKVYGLWSGLREINDGGQDSVIFSKP